MSQREDALLEQAPRGLPRPMAMAMAQVGLAYFRRKYALNGHADAARARFTEVLEQVSEALEQRATLLDGGLTFADVAIATMLHGVRPADATLAPHIRMGKATRDSWTQLDLAERFRHLLTWRDALYAARPQAPRR
jgi:glutathione S-transferase